jgi:type VI secretion system protein ImpA|tara:strand:- start:3194 stop:4513 length:1320 start_codon:yes stop_codon:yes gene_type:complete
MIELLNKPIAGDNPMGVYLKGDRSVYRALRNAFNAAQAAYRQVSETPDTLLDNDLREKNQICWKALEELTHKTLVDVSKDLEVYCWHVASKLHSSNPLIQLSQALTALQSLVHDGFDELQPILPDDKVTGDTEAEKGAVLAELKLRSFLQLFGQVDGTGLLHVPLVNLELVKGLTYGGFLLAEKTGDLTHLKALMQAATSEQLEHVSAQVEALASITLVIPNLEADLKAFASLYGVQVPSVSPFKRLISDMTRLFKVLTEGTPFNWPGQQLEQNIDASDAEIPLAEGLAPEAQLPLGTSDGADVNVLSRKQALAQLANLAHFFRQTEPHSPLHSLLDRAARWGDMSALELYTEILHEDSQGLAKMSLMTGLESAGYAQGSTPQNTPVLPILPINLAAKTLVPNLTQETTEVAQDTTQNVGEKPLLEGVSETPKIASFTL